VREGETKKIKPCKRYSYFLDTLSMDKIVDKFVLKSLKMLQLGS